MIAKAKMKCESTIRQGTATRMTQKGVIVPSTTSIEIEFDEETQDYYIVWEPLIISSGNTRQDSLEDLREAAHFAVDTLIDLKLRDIRE